MDAAKPSVAGDDLISGDRDTTVAIPDATYGADAKPTIASADAHYTAGLQCVKYREFFDAILHFSKAIFLADTEPLLYVARAEAYVNVCDLRSAIGNYRKALTLMGDPAAADDLRMRLAQILDTHGLLLIQKRRFAPALRFIEESIAERSFPLAELHRCLCLTALGDFGSAEAKLESGLIREATCNPDATVLLVELKIQKHDFATSKRLLERVLAKFRTHPRVVAVERNFDRMFQKYRTEAENKLDVDALTCCITAFSEDADLFQARAIAYANKKIYTPAVQDLFTCISKSGGNNAAASELLCTMLCQVADELIDQADYASAVNYYSEALKWNPEFYPAHVARGDCLCALGKHEAALANYKHVSDADPSNLLAKQRLGELHDRWGAILYNQSKWQLAETEFSRALSFHQKDPVMYYHRALARLMLQQPLLAVKDLLACRDLNPQDPDILRVIKQICGGYGQLSDQGPEVAALQAIQVRRPSVTKWSNEEITVKMLDPITYALLRKDGENGKLLQQLRTDHEEMLHGGKYNPNRVRDSVKKTHVADSSAVIVSTRIGSGKQILRKMEDRITEMPPRPKRTRFWSTTCVKEQSRLGIVKVSAPRPIPAKYAARSPRRLVDVPEVRPSSGLLPELRARQSFTRSGRPRVAPFTFAAAAQSNSKGVLFAVSAASVVPRAANSRKASSPRKKKKGSLSPVGKKHLFSSGGAHVV